MGCKSRILLLNFLDSVFRIQEVALKPENLLLIVFLTRNTHTLIKLMKKSFDPIHN